MSLEYGEYTDRGLVREVNQDAIYSYSGENLSLFLVADGMGGHSRGEKASGAIAECVKEWSNNFYPAKYANGFPEILADFEKKIAEANARHISYIGKGEICGSTMVALMFYREYYAVFSIGDSRVYRRRGWDFEQLTRDDVWQNSGDLPGGMSAEDIRRHADFDKLTKAFGVGESLILQRMTDKIKKGDFFLLCSDGVYKFVPEDFLKKTLSAGLFAKKTTIKEKIETIKKKVLERGASDNFSMILVQVV
ncbi:MAG: serine/threonine-protein phosphatase [Lachnospiraceae bacterium]|nr:serine/threonine-protein phosphatase [Lachnospiraceae bacterium]